MKYEINNKTGSPIQYGDEIKSLCDFAKERLGFKQPPSIFLNHDERNAGDTLGKTGYYDPTNMEIHVFATGRHPKDILRSIAHELVHHSQNEKGRLDNDGYTGKGYAQKNPHLRKMEMEANDPMLFRDWEDSLKEDENTIYNERRNREMSLKEWKNKEIGDLLTNKWGFKMNLGKLNESKDVNECAGPMMDPMAEPQMHDEMPDEECLDINGRKYCPEPEMPVGVMMEEKEDEDGNEKTEKYDDDPSLKGKQSELPDALQKAIINKGKK